MISFKVDNLSANDAIVMAHNMRDDNLKQNDDFIFSFYPAVYEGYIKVPSSVVFTFYDDRNGVVFMLKYSELKPSKID